MYRASGVGGAWADRTRCAVRARRRWPPGHAASGVHDRSVDGVPRGGPRCTGCGTRCDEQPWRLLVEVVEVVEFGCRENLDVGGEGMAAAIRRSRRPTELVVGLNLRDRSVPAGVNRCVWSCDPVMRDQVETFLAVTGS